MAMQNKKLSIRRIVSYLNDDESEGGGFWLPNIQRPFVWSEDQITRLFDSIMREYPIGTLLVWKTKEPLKHRKFIDNVLPGLKLSAFAVPDNTHSKMMVLDGQQRLQSLFVGLKGSHHGRELYFDTLSGDSGAPEDIRFGFAFKAKDNAVWPWTRFKDIIFQNNKLPGEITEGLISAAQVPLSADEEKRVSRNIERARQEFVNDDNVTFQELDGVDDPEAYRIDDVVEIFIRANSGGTRLGKSDLLFSLLAANWDAADGELEALLDDLNQQKFAFDRDFVLKSCLTVLDKGARYEVSKFRDGKTKEQIIDRWAALSASIRAVRDLLVEKTYIRSDHGIPSYLALIPLIYCRYHFPKEFAARKDETAAYLLRVLTTGVFGSSPDNLIDKLVRRIQEQKGFELAEIFDVILSDGRSMKITEDVILGQSYGSRSIHLFFNMWYREFDYAPSLAANGPQVDHIFPQSLLKTVKEVNPETGKLNIMRYRADQRDQIANCMLLTAEENGFGGKNATPPAEWFDRSRFPSDEERERYLELHLIPKDPALWELDRFDDFIDARKALILEKFSYMLQPLKVEAL